MTELVRRCDEPKRKDTKRRSRLLSARRISIIILAMAALKAFFELTSAIISLFT